MLDNNGPERPYATRDDVLGLYSWLAPLKVYAQGVVHGYALVQFVFAMENSEPQSSPKPSRKPPVALVLLNRPEDGLRILSLEPEDLRLLDQVLNWAGYQSVLVDIDDDVDRVSDAVELYKPTVILNLVDHMFSDERGASAVAGMLDLFGYVYTGSGPGVLLDCQTWSRTRLLLEHAGLPILNAPTSRHLHACLLGNDDVEHLPVCESFVACGQAEVEVCSLTCGDPEDEVCFLEASASERIAELCNQVWRALGMRDVAQIDFDVSPAGRVSIVRVHAAVDLFGTVFRTAAAAREGGMPGTIVQLSHLCHLRLAPEELLTYPLP
ncbi:MAG: hypothetical protein GY811_08390 [Myxococcales bacterium]|nr:hypothetical protein [Myxococcales bacterium]